MLVLMLRLVDRSRSIFKVSGGVRYIRNVRLSRKSTQMLPRTSLASRSNDSSNLCTQNHRAFSGDGLGLQSQFNQHAARGAKPLIKQAKICGSSKMVLVGWDDGTVSRYPFVWLRANCRCNTCWHHDAYGRISLMEDLDIDIEPTGVKVSTQGSEIEIHWPDNHLSPFEVSLLKDVTFKEDVRKKNIRLWGSELLDELPTHQFDEIMSDDMKLLNFLEDLRDVGLTLMKGVPTETGNVEKIAERISYIKRVNNGYVLTLKSKANLSNTADTGFKLGLRTDFSHHYHTAGITALHCIQQSTIGGESMFADGFKTALQLKEENPEAFQILCDSHCDFIQKNKHETEFYTKCAWPTFSFDRHGNLAEVHYDHTSRDIRLLMPVDKVYQYFKAIKTYDDLIHRPENTVNFRMQPGDMVMVNNIRILHGRKAFQVTEGAERHFEIAFLDWDCVYSRIRCLREKLGMPYHEY